MLDTLQSVTKQPEKSGIMASLVLGGVLGFAGGYYRDVVQLFDAKASREPPYVHPEIAPESLLETAYRMQPFYDIRREGTEKMLALIGEQPSALLTALAAYRNEGYLIEATGLGAASIPDVEALIQWCLERQFTEAATMAQEMLDIYRTTAGDNELPLGEARAF